MNALMPMTGRPVSLVMPMIWTVSMWQSRPNMALDAMRSHA
jgi:hypothetical protein